MKLTKKHLIAGCLTLSLVFALSLPAIVGAQTQFGGQDIPDITIFETDFGNADITVVIQSLITLFMSLLGILAVLIIMLGGFRWMMAQGDPDKVKKAKDLIYSGIIGLVIILASYAIATFVWSAVRGLFTGTA